MLKNKGLVGKAAEAFSLLYQTPDSQRTLAYNQIVHHITTLPQLDKTVGDRDRLFYHSLRSWMHGMESIPSVLAVIMVVDAFDKLAAWTDAMGDPSRSNGLTPSDKKDVTRFVQGWVIEFEVPVGCVWESCIRGTEDSRGAGFKGLAEISRCHLSESIYFQPAFNGLALSCGKDEYLDAIEQAVGFSLPCSFYPDADPNEKNGFRLEGRRGHSLVPFGWITRVLGFQGLVETWPGWAGIARKAIETPVPVMGDPNRS